MLAIKHLSKITENKNKLCTFVIKSLLKIMQKKESHWLSKYKYGFDSHWTMHQYVKSFYDNFFDFYPEFLKYKI